MFLKPVLGRRRCKGVCPPSKPCGMLTLDRFFCPFIPRPDVLPLPEPQPRPTRVRCVGREGGKESEHRACVCGWSGLGDDDDGRGRWRLSAPHTTTPTSVLAPGLSLRLLRLRKELEEEDWVLKAARQECPATAAAAAADDDDDDAGCGGLRMRRAAAPPAGLLLLPAEQALLRTVESMAVLCGVCCGWCE